jgi:hypothetical protein
MSQYRKTAIVRLVLPSGDSGQSLPLTTDRAYGVFVTIDGKDSPAGYFRSPINDDQWRDFRNKLSSCNTVRPSVNDSAADDLAFRNAMAIQDLGTALFTALLGLNKEMAAFLSLDSGAARRLVIQTQRTELHLLPWGAMCDGDGKLLAMKDLSVVQSWNDFSNAQTVTKSRLTLTRVQGPGTSNATSNAVTQVLAQSGVIDMMNAQALAATEPPSGPDILHVEAHGDDTTHQVGGVSSTRFAQRYGQPRMAMLWSCFSGAANSWGDSPALWLHRDRATLVLSFQAELHVVDAASISQGFYSEVFGPAASRDPETALIHARCTKFSEGFQNACWASMTVYLQSPLDLSALPLNGPRVPNSKWDFAAKVNPPPTPAASALASAGTSLPPPSFSYSTPQAQSSMGAALDTVAAAGGQESGSDQSAAASVTSSADDPWTAVERQICTMQPGSWKQMIEPPALADPSALLPVWVAAGWRGNVIRLDGSDDPISQEVLSDLDLLKSLPMNTNAAEKLVSFFGKIARFGAPLIIWTNSQPRHIEFLKTIAPSPALTFLLLMGPASEETLPGLVDQNRLEDARTFCETLPKDNVSDEVLSAAYYACVRGFRSEVAKEYLSRLTSFQEWLLLTGNLYSRDDKNVMKPADLLAFGSRFLTDDLAATRQMEFSLLRKPEDFYRLAMNQPTTISSLRETARGKHELGYLLQEQGQPGTAEAFYRLAIADLVACDDASQDSRWYFAMSAVLRDLSDLLSKRADRLDEASALLQRAMTIQAFRGMNLQLAYSETTAAQIALTGCHHTLAIDHALRAANRMEECVNWSGWGTALEILFDSLAETRETARMISLANLANEKIRATNLSEGNIAKLERTFKFEKAKAHWIAGELTEARDELEDIHLEFDENEKAATDLEIDRLLTFLRVARPAAEPAPEPSPIRRTHRTA